MDPIAKAVIWSIALAAFAYEAIAGKSILAGGLALFTVPFAWDAYSAA